MKYLYFLRSSGSNYNKYYFPSYITSGVLGNDLKKGFIKLWYSTGFVNKLEINIYFSTMASKPIHIR